MPGCNAALDRTESGPPASGVAAFADRVRGTNISEPTLLATDYLNHFNEIIMLVEMVPDMPELLEEAQAWRPKSYVEHFRDSTCPFRELAIELYPHVPAVFREPFELTIGQLDAVIERTLRHAEKALRAGDTEMLRGNIMIALEPLRRLVDVAASIIHGSERVMRQDEIDNVLGS